MSDRISELFTLCNACTKFLPKLQFPSPIIMSNGVFDQLKPLLETIEAIEMLGSLFAGYFVANNHKHHRHQLFDIRKHDNCSAYLSVDFVLGDVLLVGSHFVDSVAKRIFGHHATFKITAFRASWGCQTRATKGKALAKR